MILVVVISFYNDRLVFVLLTEFVSLISQWRSRTCLEHV